jgi:hypothetical protein
MADTPAQPAQVADTSSAGNDVPAQPPTPAPAASSDVKPSAEAEFDEEAAMNAAASASASAAGGAASATTSKRQHQRDGNHPPNKRTKRAYLGNKPTAEDADKKHWSRSRDSHNTDKWGHDHFAKGAGGSEGAKVEGEGEKAGEDDGEREGEGEGEGKKRLPKKRVALLIGWVGRVDGEGIRADGQVLRDRLSGDADVSSSVMVLSLSGNSARADPKSTGPDRQDHRGRRFRRPDQGRRSL